MFLLASDSLPFPVFLFQWDESSRTILSDASHQNGGGNAAVTGQMQSNAIDAVQVKEMKGYMFRKWIDRGQGMVQGMSIVIENQAAHLPIR